MTDDDVFVPSEEMNEGYTIEGLTAENVEKHTSYVYEFNEKIGILAYYLYWDNEPILTPKGIPVYALSCDLAAQLSCELEEKCDYTSATNLLCYHYTFLDMCADGWDEEKCRQTLINEFNYDKLLADPYLMLGQDSAVRQSISACYERMIPTMLADYQMPQLVAIIVVYMYSDSPVLAFSMIEDVAREVEDKGWNVYQPLCDYFEQKVFDFLTENEYEDVEGGVTELVKVLGAFTNYFACFYNDNYIDKDTPTIEKDENKK